MKIIMPFLVLSWMGAVGFAVGNGDFQPRRGILRLLESGAVDKDEIAFVWEVRDDPDWLKPYAGKDPIYQDFAQWVRGHVDPDSRLLLERNREIWRKDGKSTKKYDLVLSGRLGRLRPMNRLEAELFLIQLGQFGKPYEGEFCAFVLRKGGALRVYGQGTSKRVVRPGNRRNMRRDVADHWEYYAHLHNHPFVFSSAESSIGALIPSGDSNDGDVQYYLADREKLGLRRAWITNGFDTLEISAGDFSLLETLSDR